MMMLDKSLIFKKNSNYYSENNMILDENLQRTKRYTKYDPHSPNQS